jgi:tyrosyl-tRNA synthetase
MATPLEVIRRGTVEIIAEPELQKKLSLNRPLIIKAGFDPTAPDLHLGHTVLLRKLRHFQDLGHKVIFLIGDATALVGDPSGQSKMRKLMTPQEVHANAATYHAQVQKILRVSDAAVYQQRYNSEWFGGAYHGAFAGAFGLKELVELTSRYTVARLLERDDFQKRLKAGQEVSLLELFYPLMQGYDSVMLKADVELGGTDQKFNLLVGRNLQRAYGQEPQVVITTPLLEGTDGVQKMSKSLGNHIGIAEPPAEMFGKLMSISDALIIRYGTLLTDWPESRLAELQQQMQAKAVNPRDVKSNLALDVVAQYHGPEAAQRAKQEFFKVFSKREQPAEMAQVPIAGAKGGKVDLVAVLVEAGLAKTKNEARRLLSQGGVKLNGKVTKEPLVAPAQADGAVLQVGSRHYRRLVAA